MESEALAPIKQRVFQQNQPIADLHDVRSERQVESIVLNVASRADDCQGRFRDLDHLMGAPHITFSRSGGAWFARY